jgi:hypothetical protein
MSGSMPARRRCGRAGGYVLDGFPRTVEQANASFPTADAPGVEVQAASCQVTMRRHAGKSSSIAHHE